MIIDKDYNISITRWLTTSSEIGKRARSDEDKEVAPEPKRPMREDEEDEIGDDEDDSEFYPNGDPKPPVYHWKIWEKFVDVGSHCGTVSAGLV